MVGTFLLVGKFFLTFASKLFLTTDLSLIPLLFEGHYSISFCFGCLFFTTKIYLAILYKKWLFIPYIILNILLQINLIFQ